MEARQRAVHETYDDRTSANLIACRTDAISASIAVA
jgi:hypothetical protein